MRKIDEDPKFPPTFTRLETKIFQINAMSAKAYIKNHKYNELYAKKDTMAIGTKVVLQTVVFMTQFCCNSNSTTLVFATG